MPRRYLNRVVTLRNSWLTALDDSINDERGRREDGRKRRSSEELALTR
jgi:hypothetical protein